MSAAVVSDVLGGPPGHRDHVLDPAIRPLRRGAVIAGPASSFLVTGVCQVPAGPCAGQTGALDGTRPAEVIVAAAGGPARAACPGRAVLRGGPRPRSPRHP
jgi:regulator of RNase E activity RraA